MKLGHSRCEKWYRGFGIKLKILYRSWLKLLFMAPTRSGICHISSRKRGARFALSLYSFIISKKKNVFRERLNSLLFGGSVLVFCKGCDPWEQRNIFRYENIAPQLILYRKNAVTLRTDFMFNNNNCTRMGRSALDHRSRRGSFVRVASRLITVGR